jgi:fumarate reductase subunit D
MHMKKNIIALVLLNLLAAPVLVFAGIMPSANASLAGEIGNVSMSNTSIDSTLDTIANYVIGVLIVTAVFYIIWAGYSFVAHGTDPEEVGKARTRIMFAGIGVIVALLAKGIVSLVLAAVKGG